MKWKRQPYQILFKYQSEVLSHSKSDHSVSSFFQVDVISIHASSTTTATTSKTIQAAAKRKPLEEGDSRGLEQEPSTTTTTKTERNCHDNKNKGNSAATFRPTANGHLSHVDVLHDTSATTGEWRRLKGLKTSKSCSTGFFRIDEISAPKPVNPPQNNKQRPLSAVVGKSLSLNFRRSFNCENNNNSSINNRHNNNSKSFDEKVNFFLSGLTRVSSQDSYDERRKSADQER